jgi:hypothetical protein
MAKAVALAVALILLSGVASVTLAGGYLGAGIGVSFIRTNVEDLEVVDFELSGSDFAYKFFGGYKVIPFLSFEGGYRDLGKITDMVDDVELGMETSGWDIEAIGILPLGVAHLWVKAGYFFWNSEAGPGSNKESDNGSDFMWGLGGDISILKIAVRAEWEKFEIENTEHISMFSVGATLGF